MDLQLTPNVSQAILIAPADIFEAIRRAQATYPRHVFKVVGPFGLLPDQGYRLHGYAVADSQFDGFIREWAA